MKSLSHLWLLSLALASLGCGGSGSRSADPVALRPTVRTLDVSVDGEELFVVAAPGGVAYAESGGFGVDSGGRIVHAATGAPLLGWNANGAGTIDSASTIRPLNVPLNRLVASKATSRIRLAGSLDAEADATAIDATQARTYDADGGAHISPLSSKTPASRSARTRRAGAGPSTRATLRRARFLDPRRIRAVRD